jgi:uncharacterized repeat protein (TIGR03847 family)
MTDAIEFDPVDQLGAGAFGRPGQRTFVIQARKGHAVLSVLVEKEQVALLAAEAQQFLDRIAEDEPEEPDTDVEPGSGQIEEDEPLFRARLIEIGYDPDRQLVKIELREDAETGDELLEDAEEIEDAEESEGHIARLYATRAQVRAMVRHGAAAVQAGRPRCPLCEFPMGPDGHICPRWN